VRHDVIEDPLTLVAAKKVREKKSKKSTNNQES
jgi:hypothetical protein